MSKEALQLMIQRKQIIRQIAAMESDPSTPPTEADLKKIEDLEVQALSLQRQAQEAGGLTTEESYILMVH